MANYIPSGLPHADFNVRVGALASDVISEKTRIVLVLNGLSEAKIMS